MPKLTTLYQDFAEDSVLHSIAMMASSVMQPLLLQKPSQQRRAKNHSHRLNSRMIYERRGHLVN